jgi:hypothetical protein
VKFTGISWGYSCSHGLFMAIKLNIHGFCVFHGKNCNKISRLN